MKIAVKFCCLWLFIFLPTLNAQAMDLGQMEHYSHFCKEILSECLMDCEGICLKQDKKCQQEGKVCALNFLLIYSDRREEWVKFYEYPELASLYFDPASVKWISTREVEALVLIEAKSKSFLEKLYIKEVSPLFVGNPKIEKKILDVVKKTNYMVVPYKINPEERKYSWSEAIFYDKKGKEFFRAGKTLKALSMELWLPFNKGSPIDALVEILQLFNN